MRVFATLVILTLLVNVVALENQGDRPITRIVKMLQGLMEKNTADGKEDDELYTKFQCFCEKTMAEKKEAIQAAQEQISKLENSIAENRATNAKLSQEIKDLTDQIASDEQSKGEAISAREKEAEDFAREETDMTNAISALDQAIEVLAAIGADQTAPLPAGASLLKVGDRKVKRALMAATAFLPVKQAKVVTGFISQEPTQQFDNAQHLQAYGESSTQIVGILKNMNDTFSANLKEASEEEAKKIEAHGKLMTLLQGSIDSATESKGRKVKDFTDNEASITEDERLLDETKTSLGTDGEFLLALNDECSSKDKAYNERKALRSQENAALAQAIAILNSDDAFETFGKTVDEDGSIPSFLQLSHSKKRTLRRRKAVSLLKTAAKQVESFKLLELAAAAAEDPFAKVLEMMEKMSGLIDKEQIADDEQKKWCVDERAAREGELLQHDTNIKDLEATILGLEGEIGEAQQKLEADRTALGELLTTRSTMEKQRADEHEVWTMEDRDNKAAVGLLKQAIEVLRRFYERDSWDECAESFEAGSGRVACLSIGNGCIFDSDANGGEGSCTKGSAGAGLMQEEPAKVETGAPATFEGEATQSAGGANVISLLRDSVQATIEAEIAASLKNEQDAQTAFDAAMIESKKEETTLNDAIAASEDLIGEKTESMELAKQDKEKEQAALDATKAYLEKIKPSCDWIMEKYDTRTTHRATEKSALEEAGGLLRGLASADSGPATS